MPLLLTREDLRPLLHDTAMLEEAFDAVRASFLHHQRGEAPSFALVQLPLVDRASVVRVTPAASPVGLTLRAYPGVPAAGESDAFAVLVFDAEGGRLLALMAGDDLNVFRTAVPAGLACRLLAPGRARTLALLGSGRQAHGQARAILHGLPSIHEVRVYSPTAEHRVSFAAELRELGALAEAVESAHLAVEGADVIGIASNARAPVVEADWVRPGALVVNIGAGQVPPELALRARIIVSSREGVVGEHARREPLATLIRTGAWRAEDVAAELADVIAGKAVARTAPEQTVLFEMAGLSAWDVAIARWAYDWAERTGVGQRFSLSAGKTSS